MAIHFGITALRQRVWTTFESKVMMVHAGVCKTSFLVKLDSQDIWVTCKHENIGSHSLH